MLAPFELWMRDSLIGARMACHFDLMEGARAG
jgi:hypothetical protein